MNIKETKKNTTQAEWLVYRHIREDKNEPFYIGIGKDPKRPYSKKYRNKAWRGVVEKTNYTVDILFEGLTKEQAIEKEIEFISIYGRKDIGKGCLYNMTDGGEGVNSMVYTKERNEKISKSLTGKKPSRESIKNNRLAHSNRKPVLANGKKYDSLRECAKEYNTSHKAISYRCKSDNFPEFNFI